MLSSIPPDLDATGILAGASNLASRTSSLSQSTHYDFNHQIQHQYQNQILVPSNRSHHHLNHHHHHLHASSKHPDPTSFFSFFGGGDKKAKTADTKVADTKQKLPQALSSPTAKLLPNFFSEDPQSNNGLAVGLFAPTNKPAMSLQNLSASGGSGSSSSGSKKSGHTKPLVVFPNKNTKKNRIVGSDLFSEDHTCLGKSGRCSRFKLDVAGGSARMIGQENPNTGGILTGQQVFKQQRNRDSLRFNAKIHPGMIFDTPLFGPIQAKAIGKGMGKQEDSANWKGADRIVQHISWNSIYDVGRVDENLLNNAYSTLSKSKNEDVRTIAVKISPMYQEPKIAKDSDDAATAEGDSTGGSGKTTAGAKTTTNGGNATGGANSNTSANSTTTNNTKTNDGSGSAPGDNIKTGFFGKQTPKMNIYMTIQSHKQLTKAQKTVLDEALSHYYDASVDPDYLVNQKNTWLMVPTAKTDDCIKKYTKKLSDYPNYVTNDKGEKVVKQKTKAEKDAAKKSSAFDFESKTGEHFKPVVELKHAEDARVFAYYLPSRYLRADMNPMDRADPFFPYRRLKTEFSLDAGMGNVASSGPAGSGNANANTATNSLNPNSKIPIPPSLNSPPTSALLLQDYFLPFCSGPLPSKSNPALEKSMNADGGTNRDYTITVKTIFNDEIKKHELKHEKLCGMPVEKAPGDDAAKGDAAKSSKPTGALAGNLSGMGLPSAVTDGISGALSKAQNMVTGAISKIGEAAGAIIKAPGCKNCLHEQIQISVVGPNRTGYGENDCYCNPNVFGYNQPTCVSSGYIPPDVSLVKKNDARILESQVENMEEGEGVPPPWVGKVMQA